MKQQTFDKLNPLLERGVWGDKNDITQTEKLPKTPLYGALIQTNAPKITKDNNIFNSSYKLAENKDNVC